MSKSKKKRKNSNYRTPKKSTHAPVQKTKNDSNNKLTIALIATVLIAAIALVLIMWQPWADKLPSAPVDPNNSAGNNIEHAEKYLEEKYGLDFMYVDSTEGMSLFDAEGIPGTVAIMRREVVHSIEGVQKNLFTDMYADNGYLIVNQASAKEFFQQFVKDEDLGNYTILSYIDIIANPSAVTPDMSFAEYLDVVKELSIPEFILLTDKELSSETLKNIEDRVAATERPVTMRVVTCSQEIQQKATPNSIMIMGSGHKDVQYFMRINQEGMWGDETNNTN